MRYGYPLLALVMALGCTSASAAVRMPQVGPCRPADSISASTLPLLDSIATRGESRYVALRGVFQVQLATPNDVFLMADSGSCQTAAGVLDSMYNQPASGRSVHLYKVGTSYALDDPEHRVGNGQRILHFLTAAWTPVKAMPKY
jgi:hypothetical protein